MTGNICIVNFHDHFERLTSQIDNFFLYHNRKSCAQRAKQQMLYFFLYLII